MFHTTPPLVEPPAVCRPCRMVDTLWNMQNKKYINVQKSLQIKLLWVIQTHIVFSLLFSNKIIKVHLREFISIIIHSKYFLKSNLFSTLFYTLCVHYLSLSVSPPSPALHLYLYSNHRQWSDAVLDQSHQYQLAIIPTF